MKISQTNQADESLQEPLLTGRSGTQNTSRFQEARDRRKSSQMDSNAEFQETMDEERKKYEAIMRKLDDVKKTKDVPITDEDRKIGRNSGLDGDLSMLKRQSASQKGREERPISGRYNHEQGIGSGMGRLTNQDNGTMSQFNEDEDFRLSTEHQHSIAQFGGMHSQKSSVMNLREQLNSKRGLQTATMTDEDEPIAG